MKFHDRLLVRTAAVCTALSLSWSCGGGKRETAGTPDRTPGKPKTVAIEPAAKSAGLKPGLKVTTFPNNRFTSPEVTTAETNTIGFPCDANPYKDREVSLRYRGYLKIDQDGTYVFQVRSDDQCKLKLGPAVVVFNEESTMTKEGSAVLKAGFYPLEIDYQNNVGPACLVVNWMSERTGNVWAPIPAAQLTHD